MSAVCLFVDLAPHRNARAITSDTERRWGEANAWGNSFPEEELPPGSELTVAGIPFRLPPRAPGGEDHLEALGQSIALPRPPLSKETGEPGEDGAPPSFPAFLAFLAFGEMGRQELEIRAGIGSGTRTRHLHAEGWLTPRAAFVGPGRSRCSHLHYPGDYELDLLLPTLTAVRVPLAPGEAPRTLTLGVNPFFHILALTLVRDGRR